MRVRNANGTKLTEKSSSSHENINYSHFHSYIHWNSFLTMSPPPFFQILSKQTHALYWRWELEQNWQPWTPLIRLQDCNCINVKCLANFKLRYTEMKIRNFLQNVLTFLEMSLKYVLMEHMQYNMESEYMQSDMKIIMKSLK